MKVDELPGFLQTLASVKGPLDPLHVLYHHVFRSGYLHFGFWPDGTASAAGLDGPLDDLRSAQARFADELFACLPREPRRLLDVGAGFGRVAGELARRGYAVTAVTPCAYQAEQIVARYPEVTVALGRFEDVGPTLPAAHFDATLFAESFRYVPLARTFVALEHLLAPSGRVVIADWFVNEGTEHVYGSNHQHAALRETARAHGFDIVAEHDVTQNVLPTVKLAYDVLCEFYVPLASFVLAMFARKHPGIFGLSRRWIARWLEKKVLPQVPGRCDPAVFAEGYRYLFFVLERGRLARSGARVAGQGNGGVLG